MVTHQGRTWPDQSIWTPAEDLYAHCLLAQEPWLGSTRYASAYTEGRAESYINSGMLVCDYCDGSCHHMVFRRKDARTTPRMARN